jgi:LysM repeat protein
METKKRFEGVDIIKLCVLFLLFLIPLIIYSRGASQSSIPSGSATAITEGEVSGSGEMSNGDQTAQPGEESNLTPGTDGKVITIDDVPPPPEAAEALVLNREEKTLYTITDKAVYIFNEETKEWVPIVPEDVGDMANDVKPFLDGRGVWVILTPEKQVLFQWDPVLLVWNLGDGSVVVLPKSPDISAEGTEQTGENGQTGSTDQAGETPGTSEGETGSSTEGVTSSPTTSTGGETGSSTEGGGTPAPTSTTGGEATTTNDQQTGSTETITPTPTIAVEIPEELLIVPDIYTVRTGEYIYCISRRFDVNPNDLMAANYLTSYSVLRAGMDLVIPKKAKPFPDERMLLYHPVYYTVLKGDGIGSIACQFGDVYPEAIEYANNLTVPYTLTPGQVLIIP